LLAHEPSLDKHDIVIEQVSGGMHHAKRPKLYQLLNQLEDQDVVCVSCPAKTVPLFVEYVSYNEWLGSGIRMKMR